ncbi:hypothetical protein [Syntrophus aciditrophicus]|uniref:hypothetical protein n=1 Tax=Syntrophus aciditrophicus TaxID=316277 RepID=UPI0005A1B71B|nr:hypothetical protein [Syntrophus aciditrophicus]OPY18800.1 MAG: hypothetical protein A4E74_00450 [Syntrophus sp. PtaB.Bin075]
MKRILSVLFSALFFVTLSFAVVGCKKAEEQKPEEAVKQEAPAPAPAEPAAPAPAPAPAAPEAAPAPAPAPEAAPAPAPAK